VNLIEWGSLPVDVLTPLYEREQTRWRTALGWDTSTSWSTIESARVGWGLPGIACRDLSGTIRGWTFFMPRGEAHDQIDIGGVVADSPDVTSALIDAIVDRARTTASRIAGFLYATAPGLHAALATHRIIGERFSYLTRPTNRVPFERSGAALRRWRAQDVDRTAAFLQAAYGEAGRLFAPENSLAEWRMYVQNLLSYGGCGVLRPDLSRVIETNGDLNALALVTSLASDTAHLAQLAVSPHVRRPGLGRALIADTLKSAHASGHQQMSLLVSNSNTAACRLYRDWGFAERGEFVALRTFPPG
jgi:ribosomal protein S18 acetylase RimI-like enzyme